MVLIVFLFPFATWLRSCLCIHFTDKPHMALATLILFQDQHYVVELMMGLCGRHKTEVFLNCSDSKCEAPPCIPGCFLDLFQIFCLQILAQYSEALDWGESRDLFMITELVDLNPKARLFPLFSASKVQNQYLKSWLDIYSTAASLAKLHRELESGGSASCHLDWNGLKETLLA